MSVRMMTILASLSRRLSPTLILLICMTLLGGCATFGVEQSTPPVTVSEVIHMSQQGVPADTILDRMRESQTVYRLTASQLAQLRDQGVLSDGHRWRGYADFLERVDQPSALGSYSYEVADTKLARRVKPYFLIQLCFYSELLAAVQGVAPEWMSVILGSWARERFRLDEFASYYRSIKRNFEAVLDTGLRDTYPDLVEHCALCRWEQHCAAQREDDDYLGLVANMRRTQIVRLGERGSPE